MFVALRRVGSARSAGRGTCESANGGLRWEEPLMEAHAHAVASSRGDVLNVGFGLGLVDEVPPPGHAVICWHARKRS